MDPSLLPTELTFIVLLQVLLHFGGPQKRSSRGSIARSPHIAGRNRRDATGHHIHPRMELLALLDG